MNSKDKIIIDLDNTITIESKKSYEDKDPNLEVIKAIQKSKILEIDERKNEWTNKLWNTKNKISRLPAIRKRWIQQVVK